MATRSLPRLLLPALFVLLPLHAVFEVPLEEHSIREAYFLGQRNDEKTAQTLAAYARRFPVPEKGPQVSRVELLTPYAQVVDLSRQRTVGYSAQQAAADYRERGATIVVRFTIEFTNTYPATVAARNPDPHASGTAVQLRSYQFWRDFRFGLSQNDKWIEPRSMDGQPLFGESATGSTGEFRGATVKVEYDAGDVASEPVEAEVFTPDGQHVVAGFDLGKLR